MSSRLAPIPSRSRLAPIRRSPCHYHSHRIRVQNQSRFHPANVNNYFVHALVVFVVFALTFKFMPDAEVEWNQVAVGAVVTTVLFLPRRVAMQLYFPFSDPVTRRVAAEASLAVILVWAYYTVMIVLLDTEVTQVYAKRYSAGIRRVECESTSHRF